MFEPTDTTTTHTITKAGPVVAWRGGPVRATYPCPEPGMVTDHFGLHLTKLPRTHTTPYSYCPRCVGYATVTVDLPPLPDPLEVGDGYDWMAELRGGWVALALWGRDGWDLGQWPYQVLAVCPPRHVADSRSFGMATYTEGDIEVSAHPTQEALVDAISRYAHGVWLLAGNGPSDLPQRYEDVPDLYRVAFDGARLIAETN